MGHRFFAAVLVAAAAVIAVPIHVRAHEEHALHSLTVLESVSPQLDGVEVRIVHLDAPALVITNDTSEVITVLGEKGEPFLEIGPDGVRANAESPLTYVSVAPRRDIVPPGVRPSAKPRWAVFSDEPTWTWFDPRLRAAPQRDSWEVPMLLGGQPFVAEGGYEPLQGHGHFITTMDSPEVEGLDLRLTQGPIPALFVRNDTGDVLEVPGDADEPFLRIGSDGVEANLRSPTYYTSGSTSITKVPAIADATAAPRWKKVSPYPVWAWLERRAAVPAELYQRDALGSEQRTVLEWTTPLRLGGEPLDVRGRVEWIPPQSATTSAAEGETPIWLIAVVVAVAAAALLVLVRRPQRAA